MFLKRLKRPYKVLPGLFITCIVCVAACNLYVNIFSSHFLFNGSASIPYNQYDLVPGTGKYLVGGAAITTLTSVFPLHALFINQCLSTRLFAVATIMSDKYYPGVVCQSKSRSFKFV